MTNTHEHKVTHTQTQFVCLIFAQGEDGCHGIMLMSVSAAQSHASVAERQAGDADRGKMK